MKVIFLDFDGVIRVSVDGGWVTPDQAEFCGARMASLAKACRDLDCKIVVSSDWRQWDNRLEIEALLKPHLAQCLHDDWSTPIIGQRWKEVRKWLDGHPEVVNYAILEDYLPHFEGCPEHMNERIVLCTNRYGFVQELHRKLYSLL